MEENKLLPYLHNEKILADLSVQLTKDIALENFAVATVLPSPTAFTQLFNQVLPLIEKLETENKARLNFILNRTDISEAQLRQAIQKNKTLTYAQLVTELIIKRELQKVVIRYMHR